MSFGREAINEMYCKEAAKQRLESNMSMIQGEITSLRKDRTGFKCDENWYMLGQGVQCPTKGDKVQFEVTHQQGRDNFCGPITVTEKSPWSGGAPARPAAGGKPAGKGGYDNLGQQVGNAVTNATALLANGIVVAPEGKVIETLQALAIRIMQTGDNVRAAHENKGSAPAPVQASPQTQAANRATQQAPKPTPAPTGFDDFDDDIPF